MLFIIQFINVTIIILNMFLIITEQKLNFCYPSNAKKFNIFIFLLVVKTLIEDNDLKLLKCFF